MKQNIKQDVAKLPARADLNNQVFNAPQTKVFDI